MHAAVVTSATARQLFRQFLAEGHAARPLVDIGSSAVSGLRHPNPFAARGNPGRTVAHPVQHTRVLDRAQAVAVGSDTLRAGWTFRAPALEDGSSFTDPTGVRWAWSNGEPLLLHHPLEQAGIRAIRRYPRPQWPASPAAGSPDPATGTSGGTGTDDLVHVAEPPCPGLLELSMALRNPWQFMQDTADGWRVAGTVLDWSLEVLLEAYTQMLATTARSPDLLVYPDVLGFRAGMYLSVPDMRTQYLPRLRILLTRLRDLSPAPVLLTCRGAIGPVLSQLAALEPDLLQVQRDVAGLELQRLRTTIPTTTGLHGVVDLVRLGRALAGGDRERAAGEAVRFARAWPAVAAPLAIVPADVPDDVLARAASFIRGLSTATLHTLCHESDPGPLLAPLFCRPDDPAASRARTVPEGQLVNHTGE